MNIKTLRAMAQKLNIALEIERNPRDPRYPRIILDAPEGCRFKAEKIHSLVCDSRTDAEDRMKQGLELCPPTCECKEEGEKDHGFNQ